MPIVQNFFRTGQLGDNYKFRPTFPQIEPHLSPLYYWLLIISHPRLHCVLAQYSSFKVIDHL